MLSIRRPWWAALVLVSFAGGCSSEPAEAPGETPAVTAPQPSPVPTPTATTPADAPKPPAEMTPEPAKTEEATKDESPDLKIEAPKVEPPAKDDKPEAAADENKLSDLEVAEIKRLPAGEQAAALKQMVCPVSGEHLGSMEAPIKVSAEGKTFYLCCASCKVEVEKNPKDVVAKLANK